MKEPAISVHMSLNNITVNNFTFSFNFSCSDLKVVRIALNSAGSYSAGIPPERIAISRKTKIFSVTMRLIS